MRLYENQPSGTLPRARQLRRASTDSERHMWAALRETFPHARFRRQAPVGLYFADFLSFSAKLIIEIDGGQHADASERDAARTAFLTAQGYRVLRLWNNEVLENIDGVLAAISLSLREREGAAERRKGEGDQSSPPSLSPSPSHAAAWAPPSPVGRGA